MAINGYRVKFRRVSGSNWLTGIFYAYAAICVPYLVWRASIINWDVWYGPGLALVELYNAAMTVFFIFVVHRIDEPVFHPVKADHGSVDVFIPTYNEPANILEPTIRAALEIRGVRGVLVLDDGNRTWVKNLSEYLGAGYYPRTNNLHAKAGNMNNGLRHSDAEFIICLDADHVPVPEFVERSLGYFDDEGLAFVQAPQLFYNTTTFMYRKTRKGIWSEQGMFYDVIQPAKNRWNSAFFVGTTAMLRRSALDSVGGFATGTATEDIHTSLRLHAKGWKSIFIREALAHGLEAENLKEYFRQRRRWAAGSLGLLLRSADSPLRARGLSLVQRVNYLSACLAHLLGVQKLFYFAFPILCVATLISPTSINWNLAAPVMLGFAAISIAVTALFARGTYHLIYSEAYNLSHFLAHLSGVWGIVRVQKKFSVSRKIVARGERTWLKAYWWVMVVLALAALGGDVYLLEGAIVHHLATTGLLIISLILIVYNMVLIGAFFGYLMIYERRGVKDQPKLQKREKDIRITTVRPAFYESIKP